MGKLLAEKLTSLPVTPHRRRRPPLPFQVNAGTEQGYLATQTLSGTRLKTDLKDIGSALTVFTERMMDDLGANSIYDLMAFAPNTDPFIMSTSDITGNGNDFINPTSAIRPLFRFVSSRAHA